MNWTGGRLQRHSKANANAQLKAQKDYFARARLRRNAKSVIPRLSYFATAASEEQEKHSSRPDEHDGQNAAIDEKHSRKNCRRRNSSCIIAHNATNSLQVAISSHRRSTKNSHRTASPKINTLEHVKNSLLRQSDWMEIASTRPLKLDFKPAASPERIGRRRKLTRDDRQRQKQALGERRIEHQLIKPFTSTYDQIGAQSPQSEGVSIRIGSNIHQSQAVSAHNLSDNPPSVIIVSSSTESMLLDVVEAELPPESPKEQEQYYLVTQDYDNFIGDSLVDGHDAGDEAVLVPLEKVRDRASFDEVKAYFSSSMKYTASNSDPTCSERPLLPALNQSGPQQLTSSSSIKARPLTGRGSFSSAGNSCHTAIIDSEPPCHKSHPCDTVMKNPEASPVITETCRICHEIHERPCHGHSGPQKTFEDGFHVLTTPERASQEPKDNNILVKNGIKGITPSASHEKPPYTIEQQAFLETRLTEPIGRQFRPQCINRGSCTQSESSVQYDRSPRQDNISQTSELNSPGARLFPQRLVYSQKKRSRFSGRQNSAMADPIRRQSNEDEAWIHNVLSTDSDKLQQRFSFAKAPARQAITQKSSCQVRSRRQSCEDAKDRFLMDQRSSLSQNSSNLSLQKTFRTAANMTRNGRKDSSMIAQENIFLPSEIKLLSQRSPRLGYQDRRLTDLPTYKNDTRTIHGLTNPPSASKKRSASIAFSDSSYGQHGQRDLLESNMGHVNALSLHRVPLHVLHQASLRIPVQIGIPPDSCRDEKNMSKPFWKNTMRPAPLNLKSNKVNQSFDCIERTQTLQRSEICNPLYYTPPRRSASQHRTARPSSGSILHTTSSSLNSEFSSPSHHWVPPHSRERAAGTGVGFNKGNSIRSNLAGAKMSTLLARFGASTPSKYATGVLASSSSAVSYHKDAKLRAQNEQSFVFRSPE